MNLENILAISGLPGLYRLVTTRKNGLVVEDYDNSKRLFISLRKHQFTPLESVAIYTYSDVEEIEAIFRKMLELKDSEPVPASNASAQDLHQYFRKVLPDYNEDKVFMSDIKKVIKWFSFLDARDMLAEVEEPKGTSEEE